MTMVVVGGGAIGLLVAGRLAHASQRVVVLARPRTVQALNAQPLRIVQKDGQTQVVDRLVAATEPHQLPDDYQHPDLAILSVKGYDTAGALPTLAALKPALVLTLQNGIGNEELLAAHFGPARVLSGAITSSVEMQSPGEVAVLKMGSIGLAPVNDTNDMTGVHRWSAVLRQAGFPTREYADYRALKWSKALLNMIGNATSAILDRSVEAVYANPCLVALERRMFLEGLVVMNRLGIRPVNLPRYPTVLLAMLMRSLPPALLNPLLRRAVAGGRGGKAPSLCLALRQGHTRTEADTLYGAVARTACEVGEHAPVNAALSYAVSGIASGALPWETFRHRPERLLELVGMGEGE
ncbi:MAG: ketopantoate reductase family protein [Chloroflexaceae bacterium]|nr:ketopantoate reductase family protein [Chloroflexaceae bacterium]